mgnify:CR=1 FL=1
MSHAPTPQPRPALRKAPDGSVHPASVLLSSLAVRVPTPGSPDSTGAKKGKKGKKKSKPAPVETTEVVALQVELDKPVRKALRKRAAEYGWSAEEAAAHVLRVWAEN